MRPRGVFTISPVPNRSGITSYQVSGTKLNGDRIRQIFTTEGEALDEKHRLEKEAANFEAPKGEISYVLNKTQLRDAEKAIAILNHGTLAEAALYYVVNHVPVKVDKTLEEAYSLYLDAKKHLRELSLRSYTCDLKMLIDAKPAQFMNDVTGDLLKSFLTGKDPIPGHKKVERPWSLARQRYLLKVIAAFFEWGVREGYCATNPAKKVRLEQLIVDEGEPAVLGLPHLQALLDVSWNYLGGRYAAYVVLGTWAALRPTETRELDVSCIDLTEDWIKVTGSVAKTRARRVVELMPNAVLMLRDLKDRNLLINEALEPSQRDWLTIRALAGLAGHRGSIPEWCFQEPNERLWKDHRAIELRAPCSRSELVDYVKDVLRHTGISHHLAWFNDENRAAIWAGNSPRITHKHYKGLVTHLEAQGFWTMLPTALKTTGKQASLPNVRRI